MARKTKTFQIDLGGDTKKDVEVRELTVNQIMKLLEQDEYREGEETSEEESRKTLIDIFDSELLPLCTNLKKEDFLDMAPSDIKEIWDSFKDVNSVFFGLARQTGLLEVFERIKGEVVQLVQEEFSKRVVGLSNQDMLESSTTDTPT